MRELTMPQIGDRVVFFDEGYSDCVVTVTVVKVAYPNADMITVQHEVGWERWIFPDEIVMTLQTGGRADG